MNDYWEDQDMSDTLKKVHDGMVLDMGLPSWALIDCPFCEKKLSPRSIRHIGLCYNARNIGDVSVEFCCDDCKKMDTLYYRSAGIDTQEFTRLFMGNDPGIEPLTEEKMYKLQYNNLVERMISSQGD